MALWCAAVAAVSPVVGWAQSVAMPPESGLPSDLFDEGVRGQLRPVRHTVLAAGINGQIGEFRVRLGNSVAAGEELVRMVCDELDASFAVASARVGAATARYSVNRSLAEANNVSGLDVDLSRAELTVARAERDRISAQRRYCMIKAPFDGVVVEKLAEAHQHVTAGTPLLELVDNAELEVEVAVPSAWLSRVAPGVAFEMALDETGGSVRGEFLRTVGRVDPVSQTVRVIGRLVEPPPGLMTGMSGSLRVVH